MRTVLSVFLFWLAVVTVSAQQTVFVPNCAGTNDTAAFSSIITTIGSNTGTISLPYKTTATRCAVNSLTLPSNVTLSNENGSGLKVNTGQTLTIVGPVNSAAGKQLFFNAQAGQGTVSFAGNSVVTLVYPAWWGSGGGATTAANTAAATATVQPAVGVFPARTISSGGAGIGVSNGSGAGGNPTISPANDLAAVEGLSSTGIAVRTGTDAWAQRAIAGTANQVNVSNGDGVAGPPTLSLPQDIHAGATPTFSGGLFTTTTPIVTLNSTATNSLGQLAYSESGVLKSAINLVGSSYTDATRAGDIELRNLNNTRTTLWGSGSTLWGEFKGTGLTLGTGGRYTGASAVLTETSSANTVFSATSASGTPTNRVDTFKVTVDGINAVAAGVGNDIAGGYGPSDKRFLHVQVPAFFGNENDPTVNYAGAAYYNPLRVRMNYVGDPNLFAKYQGVTSWVNIDPSGNTSGTIDAYGFDAEAGISDTTNTFNFFQIFGANTVAFVRGSGGVTGAMIGAAGRSNHFGSGTVASGRGLFGWMRNLSTGTVTDAFGAYGAVSNENAGGTITTGVGLDSNLSSNAGTIGTWYGVRVRGGTTGAGTTGTRYGIYIADQGAGTITGSIFNLYSVGASRNNHFEGNLSWDGAATLKEGAAPSTPAADRVVLYAKSDGKLYSKDDAGTETPLGGTGDVVAHATRTDNRLTKWTTASSKIIGNSLLSDDGFNVTQNGGKFISTQGSITSSAPALDHTATWNSLGTTFTNFLSNVTDTASASGSLLMDLQVGGTTRFNVRKDGQITSGRAAAGGVLKSLAWLIRDDNNSIPLTFRNPGDTDYVKFRAKGFLASRADTSITVAIGQSGEDQIEIADVGRIAWASSSNANTTKDIGLRRDAAGRLSVYDGVTTTNYRDVIARSMIGGGSAPSCAVGSNGVAGAGATCSVSGNNFVGTITVTTGTGIASTGSLVTATFAAAFPAAPACGLTLANTNAGDAQGNGTVFYVNTETTTTLPVAVTGVTLVDSTQYKINYVCGGR